MKLLFPIIFIFFTLSFSAFGQRDVNSLSDKLFDLRQEGKYDEAILDLDDLIEKSPNDPKLYIKRAEFLKLQDKLNEAISNIDRAIELEPREAMFYIERAKYFNFAKNNQAVFKNLQTAVSLAPNKPIVLINAAEELKVGKQYEESIEIADLYIARSDSGSELSEWLRYYAYKIRSENKFALKNYVEALEDSIKSIELLPFTGDKEKDLRAINEIGDLTQINVILPVTDLYLKNDKKIFNYYNQIFDALKRKLDIRAEYIQNFYDDRRKLIKPNETLWIQEYDKLRLLMINCAKLYAEKGQPEKGVEIYEKIINLKSEPKWLDYNYRARFYIKIGKYKEAIDDLSVVLREQIFLNLLVLRGDLYVLTNQLYEAIADYETAKIMSKNIKTETIDKNFESEINEKIKIAKQKMIKASN